VDFVLLEFVNGVVALVHSDEVDQFAVLLDRLVRLFDFALEADLVLLLSLLRLEERLESGLSEGKFFELLLVVPLFALLVELLLLCVGKALHCVQHTEDVEHFTLNPNGSLEEWVPELLNNWGQVVTELTSLWMGQNTRVHLILREILDC